MKLKTFALILSIVGPYAPIVFAKPTTTSISTTEASKPEEEASQRFQKGVKLFRERSFDAAFAEFMRAYEYSPDYRVLYNLAQVQAERGDYVSAVEYFRRYIKDGANLIDSARAADVRAEIAQLEGRIAKLKIVVTVDGAEVVVDGESYGTLPKEEIFVNSGIRRLIVRKSGFKPVEQRITLAGGEEKLVKIELVPENPEEQQVKASKTVDAGLAPIPPGANGGANTGFWLALVATGVAASGTITFALMTRSDKDEFESELNRFPGSISRIDEARNQWKRDALITDICAAGTLVGLGATIYFAVSGKNDSPKETLNAPHKVAKTRGFYASPTMGRDEFGMRIYGQF
jgi:tetratricopeptide (TPR) repeat protein